MQLIFCFHLVRCVSVFRCPSLVCLYSTAYMYSGFFLWSRRVVWLVFWMKGIALNVIVDLSPLKILKNFAHGWRPPSYFTPSFVWYASFRGCASCVSYNGVCITVSCQQVSISIALSEIADTDYRHCVVFCKLSSREVLSIQYPSSKLIAFPMWFYYGEEVLDQNLSSILDNVYGRVDWNCCFFLGALLVLARN